MGKHTKKHAREERQIDSYGREGTMLYQLMNKDVVVATYEETTDLGVYEYHEVEQLDGYLPYGFGDINY